MYRIAFVDDSKEQQKIYEDYIKQFKKEFDVDITTVKYYDGNQIVFEYKSNFDIIFLDVEMQKLNGIDTAKDIRKIDKNVIIVFATNMSQYAVKGYAVNALDYLLKPVTYFAFKKILLDSFEDINNNKASYLLIHTDDAVVKVDINTIMFFESLKHKVRIVTKNKEYFITATIKSVEEEVSKNKLFYRCNNCYIVNMKYINKVVEEVVVVGKHELLISKRRKKSFMTALADYIGGGI